MFSSFEQMVDFVNFGQGRTSCCSLFYILHAKLISADCSLISGEHLVLIKYSARRQINVFSKSNYCLTYKRKNNIQTIDLYYSNILNVIY